MLENLWWRRAFGYEAALKMFDDFIDGFVIFDESDNVHLSSAGKTEQWIHFRNVSKRPEIPGIFSPDNEIHLMSF